MNNLRLKKNSINNEEILAAIRSIAFTKTDLRAAWIGDGIPDTKVKDFQLLAKWATQHLKMYLTFSPFITDAKNNVILDIGCGVGHATLTLSSLFSKSRFIGIDMDYEAVEFAMRYNTNDHIQYLTRNIFEFNSTKKFTYIFALEILEHIPALLHDLFIQKCLDLLADDGKLFLTTPNALDEKDSAYGHIGMLNACRAPKFFSKYRNNIAVSSFIDNKKLLDKNIFASVVEEPLASFREHPEKKSHFRLVFKKMMHISMTMLLFAKII